MTVAAPSPRRGARAAAGDLASRASWRALALLGVSLAGYLVARHLAAPTMIDLGVYRVEGDAVRHGVSLYAQLPAPDGLQATYPPFAGLLFVPLTWLALGVDEVLGIAVNLALVAVLAAQSARLLGVARERRVDTVLVITAVGIWAEPVWTTNRYGQINLLLAVLVLADFLRRPGARTQGVGVGLAAGIKLTPAVFVVYLLLTRRWRAAGVAVATFAATALVPLLVLPHDVRRFWTDALFDSSRVGRTEDAANQSLRGLFARLTHQTHPAPAWSVLVLLVAVAGLLTAALAHRRLGPLGDAWGVPACAVTGLLVSPISWTHHWVWCVPIAALLWTQARRWVVPVAVFWTFAVWAVPHVAPRELHFPVWEALLSAWYVWFGLFFLFLTLRTVRAARHRALTHNDLVTNEIGAADGLATP